MPPFIPSGHLHMILSLLFLARAMAVTRDILTFPDFFANLHHLSSLNIMVVATSKHILGHLDYALTILLRLVNVEHLGLC